MIENLENLSEIGSRYCLPLNSPEAALPLVGGKALNLGRLVREGFRVTDGFTVTVYAYSDFVNRAGLSAAIAEEIASIEVDDPAALASQSERLRARFNGGAIPPGLAAAIRASFAALGTPPWQSVARQLPKICRKCPLPASTTPS